MDDKVYTQEIIQDTPFPGELSLLSPTTPSNPVGTYSPTTTKESSFPVKRISRELLSTALNTRSRKVLQEFELQQSGGFQIGNFQEGISGDLKLTPNGLVARDIAGNTTFAIDGTDGSAVFRGTVQAADFIVADENGLVSAANFQSDSYRASTTLAKTNSFSEDVAGSDLNFTLVRPAKVLITFFANVWMNAIDSFRAYHIDVGASIDNNMTFAAANDFARFEQEGVQVATGTCLTFAKTYLLASGQHNIKLKWAAFSDAEIEMRTRGLDYCMLGS